MQCDTYNTKVTEYTGQAENIVCKGCSRLGYRMSGDQLPLGKYLRKTDLFVREQLEELPDISGMKTLCFHFCEHKLAAPFSPSSGWK